MLEHTKQYHVVNISLSCCSPRGSRQRSRSGSIPPASAAPPSPKAAEIAPPDSSGTSPGNTHVPPSEGPQQLAAAAARAAAATGAVAAAAPGLADRTLPAVVAAVTGSGGGGGGGTGSSRGGAGGDSSMAAQREAAADGMAAQVGQVSPFVTAAWHSKHPARRHVLEDGSNVCPQGVHSVSSSTFAFTCDCLQQTPEELRADLRADARGALESVLEKNRHFHRARYRLARYGASCTYLSQKGILRDRQCAG